MSISLIVTFAKQNAHSEIFFAITDLAQAFGFMFMMEARSGFLQEVMETGDNVLTAGWYPSLR